MKIRPLGDELLHTDRRRERDGQTDRYNEANSRERT